MAADAHPPKRTPSLTSLEKEYAGRIRQLEAEMAAALRENDRLTRALLTDGEHISFLENKLTEADEVLRLKNDEIRRLQGRVAEERKVLGRLRAAWPSIRPQWAEWKQIPGLTDEEEAEIRRALAVFEAALSGGGE